MQCIFDQNGVLIQTFGVEGDLLDKMLSLMEPDHYFYDSEAENITMQTQYLDTDEGILPRPQMQLTFPNTTTIQANGVDLCKIDNIPFPCKFEIDGDAQEDIMTDSIEFTLDAVGEYTMTFKRPPYIDKTVVVIAI